MHNYKMETPLIYIIAAQDVFAFTSLLKTG